MKYVADQQGHKADGLRNSKGKDNRALVDMSKHTNSDTIVAELGLSSARGQLADMEFTRELFTMIKHGSVRARNKISTR